MTKQEFIAHKIGILIREGQTKDRAAAIAYSMYERGDYMQEGGQKTNYNYLNTPPNTYWDMLLNKPVPNYTTDKDRRFGIPAVKIGYDNPKEAFTVLQAKNNTDFELFNSRNSNPGGEKFDKALEYAKEYGVIPEMQNSDYVGASPQARAEYNSLGIGNRMRLQEGGLPTAQQGLYFANSQDLYGNMIQNAQNMQPTNQPPGYVGIPSTSYPAAPQPLTQQDYNTSKGYDPKMGFTDYKQGDMNGDGTVDAKDKTDKFGQPSQGQPNAQYNDYIKYNILNPYSSGMDLSTSLAYTGQQFGKGNSGMGAVGAGLSLLKGARSYLSGYASGKGQQELEKSYHENQFNRDEDLYNRDVATYQGGGETEEEQPLFDIEAQTQSPEWLTSGARMPVAPTAPQPDITGAVEAGAEALASAQETAKAQVEDKGFDKSSARDTWEKKTGLPWSEARRLGYTDGTAKDNIKLLGELNDPRFKKENLRTAPFSAPKAQAKAAVKGAEAVKQVVAKNFFDSPEYKALPKRDQAKAKAVIQAPTYDQNSWGIDRIAELLGNPGQTLAHIDKYGELPSQGFSMHEKKNLDQVVGMLNPAAWANSALNAAKYADQAQYKKAGVEAIGALPALGKLAKLIPSVEYLPMLQGLPQFGAQAGRGATQIGQGAQRLGQGALKALPRQEGGYAVGGEYDLTEEEIQDLIKAGYKISYK